MTRKVVPLQVFCTETELTVVADVLRDYVGISCQTGNIVVSGWPVDGGAIVEESAIN